MSRFKMPYKTIISYLLLMGLILFIIFQGLILGLPAIVGTLIQNKLPKILEGSVLAGSDLKFKIEKVGKTHALVTGIKLGEDLSVDLAEIQYRLEDFKTLNLEKIIIFGLTVHAILDSDNLLRFNGIKIPGKKKEPDPDQSKASFFSMLPEKIVFKGAVLSIKTMEYEMDQGMDQEIKIPFELLASIQPNKQKVSKQKLSLNASFYPFGQEIKTIISGDLSSGLEFVKVEARSFNPEFLSSILRDFLPDKTKVHFSGPHFSGPVDMDLLKTRDTDWKFNISGLNLESPDLTGIISATKIKNFTASVQADKGKLIAMGGFDLSTTLALPMGLEFGLTINPKQVNPKQINPKQIDPEQTDQNQNSFPFFDLTMKNKAMDTLSLTHGSFQAIVNQPNFDFSFKGDFTRQTGQFGFDCKNTRVKYAEETLFVRNILVNSGIQGDFSGKGKGISFDIKSDLSGIKLASGSGQVECKAASLAGKLGVSKLLHPMVMSLEARIKNGKMVSKDLKISASGINARMPFVFPLKGSNKSGSFSIAHIVYDKEFKAALKGNIIQSQSVNKLPDKSSDKSYKTLYKSLGGIKVNGIGTMPDFKGFKLDFNGEAGFDKQIHASIYFKTDPFSLTSEHMGKQMPDFSMDLDSFVRFSSKGTIAYKDHRLQTQASIMLDDGRLFFPDMDLLINGIVGGIDFNDLITPESLPGQVLTIESIKTSQFQFDNAKLKFSIEDGNSLNIENLRFNWCKGLVSTESVRLPAKDNNLSLILYCDRLELSEMLKQMGAFHAEGEGTLNGRIPMVYSNGNISFDNGFLFSTPGSGGRVVIENTEKIIAGIPMDTPEFAQLDLAREALKDFDYKWAKLELNTFEDTLNVKMQLDGKPAGLLPFEYKKDIGSFVRVDGSSPGSRFQGIKMDVNLKLPFNQVMKFGNKIKTIFN